MYSRRDFTKSALAAWPLASAAATAKAAAAAEIDSTLSGVRIGVQTYSFRAFGQGGQGNAADRIIQAMTSIGLGECELWSPQIEQASPAGTDRARAREELRQWRLSAPLETFRGARKKFDAAGIRVHAYNLSFNDSFTDEEIDSGFEMAKALGVGVITASSTLSAARRVAPFAAKHNMIVSMHGHSNTDDPNEFATPESFEAAMKLSEHFRVNLDIGHFFAAGYDPVAYLEQRHDRITNLHLKDRGARQGPNTPWGAGSTPIAQVLRLVRDKKYAIPADIEYEYEGAEGPEAEVRKCFDYCKKALS
jgi:sugar phosphate isomerase/epimerase